MLKAIFSDMFLLIRLVTSQLKLPGVSGKKKQKHTTKPLRSLLEVGVQRERAKM